MKIPGQFSAEINNVLAADTAALVENFPGPYRNRDRLLVALFLSREHDYLGVSMAEKKSVHAAISHLVQPEAANPSLQVLPRTGHSRQSRRHGGVEHDKHNKVPTSDTPSNGESRFDACNSCIT